MRKPRMELEKELALLHKDIAKMSADIEYAMDKTEKALLTMDTDLADEIILGDDRIDAMERRIVEECLCIIARQQPIATDLRDISTILKIVTDFERIADHCEDISRYIKLINELPPREEPLPFRDMAQKARAMLRDVVEAYINKDMELALRIIQRDDEIDRLFREQMNHFIAEAEQNPVEIRRTAYFLYMLKYFERIADHIVNIAEWICYYIVGKRELERDESDFND